MLRALDEYEIEGLKTLIPFHTALLATEQWANAETARDLLEDKEWLKTLAFDEGREAGRGRRGGEGRADLHRRGLRPALRRQGHRRRRSAAAAARAPAPRRGAAAASPSAASARRGGGGGGGDTLASPLQGNVWKVLVEQGQKVEEGQLVTIIEAMKMENEITAHKAGVIAELPIKEGGAVAAGDTLAVISRPIDGDAG